MTIVIVLASIITCFVGDTEIPFFSLQLSDELTGKGGQPMASHHSHESRFIMAQCTKKPPDLGSGDRHLRTQGRDVPEIRPAGPKFTG